LLQSNSFSFLFCQVKKSTSNRSIEENQVAIRVNLTTFLPYLIFFFCSIDPYQFDTETHITGSFNLPPESNKKKNMQQSYHTWRPQKPSINHRSRLTPVHRSASIAAPSIEDYKMRSRRPLTNLEISSKIKNNQDLYYPSKTPSSYKSSIYINHTDNKLREKPDPNLYLDPQTGIV